MTDIKNIIESLLFVAEHPLTISRIKLVLGNPDSKAIQKALDSFLDEYEKRKGGFFLSEVAGGYQIRTRPEYNEWIKAYFSQNPFVSAKQP